jgi:arylformamidase
MADGWIDVSVGLHDGMVHWPGDPEAHIARALSRDRGDAANVSKLDMGAHTGTHMDAPLHFIDGGAGIDAMPLEVTVGPARVIEIRDPRAITAEEIAPYDIQAGERVLFQTSNSPRCWQTDAFVDDAVYLSLGAARHLAERGVRVVGVDYLSVGGFNNSDGAEIHRVLLSNGIWIIEGLDLTHAPAGTVEMICLPLRIIGCDGAPARAILRQR